MHLISELLKQRLAGFKNSLVYKVNSRAASQDHRTNVFKRKRRKRRKRGKRGKKRKRRRKRRRW